MERLPSGDDEPLDPALIDLILKPGSNKIRRPPNAFMLFAKDHRTSVADQHPEEKNKAISTRLGQIWKSIPDKIRKTYYTKAHMLADLHKKQYPGYVYSPVVARRRKMNKKKMRETSQAVQEAEEITQDLSVILKERDHREIPTEENRYIDDDGGLYKEPSPEYAPNNPEYFAQGSPEMPEEIDPDVQLHPEDCDCEKERSCDDMPVDVDETRAQSGMYFGRSLTPSRGGCHIRHTLEPIDRRPSPYRMRGGTSPHSSELNQCSCCTPRPYQRTGPPSHYYWDPPIPRYYQVRDCGCDDQKPKFTFSPPHYPDLYPYSCYDRNRQLVSGSPSSGCYYPDWGSPRTVRNGLGLGNPEVSQRYNRVSDKPGNSFPPHWCRPSCNDEAYLQYRRRYDPQYADISPCPSEVGGNSQIISDSSFVPGCDKQMSNCMERRDGNQAHPHGGTTKMKSSSICSSGAAHSYQCGYASKMNQTGALHYNDKVETSSGGSSINVERTSPVSYPAGGMVEEAETSAAGSYAPAPFDMIKLRSGRSLILPAAQNVLVSPSDGGDEEINSSNVAGQKVQHGAVGNTVPFLNADTMIAVNQEGPPFPNMHHEQVGIEDESAYPGVCTLTPDGAGMICDNLCDGMQNNSENPSVKVEVEVYKNEEC